MARRRRLDPPSLGDLAVIRAEAAEDGGARPSFDPLGAPPIARIAADSVAAQRQEIDALRAVADGHSAAARRLAEAESQGAIVVDVALEEIDVDYLSRDRLPRAAESEEWAALRSSIQTHGQRTPVELARLGTDAARPYGLISGFRRIAALNRLFAETGDPRFSRAKALARPASSLSVAFVAMVEENEIREGLSYFERGQVCVRAAEQGAFATVDAALDAMFAAASPAKRSKIRSFVQVAEELGDLLVYPEAIGERLGLRLAQAIKKGRAGELRRVLAAQGPATTSAADEQTALVRALTAVPGLALETALGAAPGAASGRRGLVEWRRLRDGVTFRLRGATLSDAEIDRLCELLAGRS